MHVEFRYDGVAIKELGKHTLVVTAVDVAGNKTEKTINFTIEEKKANEDNPKDEGNKPGEDNPKDEGNKPADNTPTDNNKVDIKEESTNPSTSNEAKIPQLGSPIGINVLVVSGLTIISIGAAWIFISKRRQNKIN